MVSCPTSNPKALNTSLVNFVPDLPELNKHIFAFKHSKMAQFKWYESSFPHERYERTLAFVKKNLSAGSGILDVGIDNPLSELLRSNGYIVENTRSKDLDLDFDEVSSTRHSTLTAFEVLEHMVSPFPLLQSAKANKLFASVPLDLWFSKAYKGVMDPFDKHYHEFEPWQFDWLLEKAGWEIVDTLTWAHSPGFPTGIRPLLRKITPRYYLVFAKRNH